MTISNTSVATIYNGNGVTTTFAITQKIRANSEVVVYLRSADGSQTLQTSPTHYSLTGGPPATNVQMVIAPASDQKLVIVRDTSKTQDADYIGTGPFLAETHEDVLDKVVQLIQELNYNLRRAPLFNLSSNKLDYAMPEPVAGGILRYNLAGNALEAIGADFINPTLATVGAAIPLIIGSRASPINITATGLDAYAESASKQRQLWFVQSSTAGQIDITTNPQIAFPSTVGQELIIVGCDATKTVLFEDGNGLKLKNSVSLGLNDILHLMWDGTNWVELADKVSTDKLNDLAVTAAKLATDAVTTAKILNLNVTEGKIAADAVTTAKILDLNVTSGKLAANSVITSKILDANVTWPKMAGRAASAAAALGEVAISVNATFSTSSLVAVTAFTNITLVTSGLRPVMIIMVPTSSGVSQLEMSCSTVTANVRYVLNSNIRLSKNGSGSGGTQTFHTRGFSNALTTGINFSIPTGAAVFYDFPTAGTQTYNMLVNFTSTTNTGTPSLNVQGRLMAFEI